MSTKYSVNVPDEVASAARDAARLAEVTPAEWTRRALVAALHPPGDNPDLVQALEDLARTRGKMDKLASDAAEAVGLRDDLTTCNQMLKEREDQVKTFEMQMCLYQDQIQILEERARSAEMKAALGERDLETAEAKLRGSEAVQAQMEERLRESRAVNSQNEGLIASLMTAQNRLLTEAGRPWWKFWKA